MTAVRDRRRRAFTDERDAEILRQHIDEGLNLSEIADLHGITRERVRQIVAAAGQRTLTRERRRADTEARAAAVAARREARAAAPFPHGTRTGYERGCSCDECLEAHRVGHRTLIGKPPPTHGESGYFNYRCRCEICCAAASARNAHEYLVRKKRRAAT